MTRVAPPEVPSWEELQTVGIDAGLDAVGVTDTEPFGATRQDLEHRRAAGRHAGMAFTFRNPARSTDPRRLLGGARSLVVGARGYLEPTPPRPPGPTGSVARYARRDHYAELRSGLEAIAAVLRRAGHRAVVVADSNGLVDRAAAYRAGIGWWGRNSNLLLPGHGSWFVLGAVATTADLGPDRSTPQRDGCGSCTRCGPACPTGAIVADRVVDARRCLAWLLQRPGVFPRAHRVALGDRIYGCDDCQDACPPGVGAVRAAESARGAGSGPAGPRPSGGPPSEAWVDVLGILRATDAELLDRHGRWYVPERNPRYLRRNALVVLGNVGNGADDAQRVAVDRVLAGSDDLLRAHAVWTAARLGWPDLVGSRAHDTSPLVRAEVALAPTVPAAPGAGKAAPVALGPRRRRAG